ncbi:MAG: DUF188 domain-containing protein [Spirochaetaceae bacterium]
MKIWVDADSCPRSVREIICRASRRTGVAALFVANREIPLPRENNIELVLHPDADSHILASIAENDMVVTRDIPLAARIVDRGVCVMNDRGTLYTAENVRERLSIRDYMKELRDSGAVLSQRDRFGKDERAAFAATFDRELTRLLSRSSQQGHTQ